MAQTGYIEKTSYTWNFYILPSSSFNTYPLPSYLLSQKNMSWKMIMTNLGIPCQVAIPAVFCLFQTICSVVFFSFRKV